MALMAEPMPLSVLRPKKAGNKTIINIRNRHPPVPPKSHSRGEPDRLSTDAVWISTTGFGGLVMRFNFRHEIHLLVKGHTIYVLIYIMARVWKLLAAFRQGSIKILRRTDDLHLLDIFRVNQTQEFLQGDSRLNLYFVQDACF